MQVNMLTGFSLSYDYSEMQRIFIFCLCFSIHKIYECILCERLDKARDPVNCQTLIARLHCKRFIILKGSSMDS